MFESFDSLRSPCRCAVPTALLLFVAGCGYSQYEARLTESKNYYAHLDRIEQALAPKWTSQNSVLELRVPRQFVLIPPPQPIKKDDGTLEFPAIDPRQPDYVNLLFPELYGAWETNLKVAKKDGTAEDRKGYIYALSNYWELAGEKPDQAVEFFNNLKAMMSDKLGVPATDEPAFVYPKTLPAYQPQVTYDKCIFKEKDIEGVSYSFDVYARRSGSVMGVIVIVLPDGMDAPQKINERIPYMLGSFTVTSIPPKAGADKNAAPQQAAPGVQF